MIDQKMERKLNHLRHFVDYGEVVSITSRTADVQVNGRDSVTRGIPFRSDLTLSVGDKVIILNLNFNKNERLIMDTI